MSGEGPRLGFLGLGWIGLHRLGALLESGAQAVAVCDRDPAALARARELAPNARVASSLADLLREPLDGLVIATPSALHAEQALRALEQGLPVFCQKPLGRDQAEVARVVAAARRSDRLLGVDFSYRYTAAMLCVSELARSGELGRIYAARLTFHNAYGPDKPWFYDARLSGGGALMDLGSHLVDLALWVLGFPALRGVSSQLFAQATPIAPRSERTVEDYASAQLAFEGGVAVDLCCSWKLHAGCDCVIEADFYGTRGAACLRNLDGSFYDFTAEAHVGTSRRLLVSPPDAWGGRAAVAWAARLARDPSYDAAADEFVHVARVLDGIYAAAPPAPVEETCAS